MVVEEHARQVGQLDVPMKPALPNICVCKRRLQGVVECGVWSVDGGGVESERIFSPRRFSVAIQGQIDESCLV